MDPSLPKGKITGYALKLARESALLSQEAFAETLGVDRATVQGWESGRRPFTSVSVEASVSASNRLIAMGAAPELVRVLQRAPEADTLLSSILSPANSMSVNKHPLANSVLTHALTELLMWPLTGVIPGQVASAIASHPSRRRRGPVADGPTLTSPQNEQFFEQLRTLSEMTSYADVGPPALLRRQACFLAGMAPVPEQRRWLTDASSSGRPRSGDPSIVRWAQARSLATALTRQGDPGPLRAFIAAGSGDTYCETAHLNYSAYWAGEMGREYSDGFMSKSSDAWYGHRLLAHLTRRLTENHLFVDLSSHTLWLLMARRPTLAREHPALTAALTERLTQLLDTQAISQQSRQELTSVLYGLRVMG